MQVISKTEVKLNDYLFVFQILLFFKDNIGCIKLSDNLESIAPRVGLFL